MTLTGGEPPAERPGQSGHEVASQTKQEVVVKPVGKVEEVLTGVQQSGHEVASQTKQEVVVKPVGKVEEKLTAIQWVGTGLAAAVGTLIATVTVLVVVYALRNAPVPPVIPVDQDAAAKLIANYKLLTCLDAPAPGPRGP